MIKPVNALTQNASAADGTPRRTTPKKTPHHSDHSAQRSEHYHKNIAAKPSGVDGVERVRALNPTTTLPQASAVNTETMGPG